MTTYGIVKLIFSIVFDAGFVILLVNRHGLSGWQIVAIVMMVFSGMILGMIHEKEGR